MVTMNSDKAAIKRKPDSHTSGSTVAPIKEKPTPIQQLNIYDESPIMYQYRKIEKIIEKMHSETTGVPIRTVKSFMSSIPSVFTGSDLVIWIMKHLDIDEQQEALHLAHLIASHGYIFPIDDHMLSVKNDGSYYRFQTLYFWPSNFWEPENTDYAIYLCKRTMQNKAKLALADYEAENLAKLQKTFSRKWEFIFMQAEAQSKVDKKRDKLERKVLDSQERAFWDLHRPMPGCVNTTEIDIRKASQKNKHVKEVKLPQIVTAAKLNSDKQSKITVESLKKQISFLKFQVERSKTKVSKAAETFIIYYEQYLEYDPFLVATELPNPWVSDNTEIWDQENIVKDISVRRVKRWAFSLRELLADPLGRDHFEKFLHKEFSGENLKFWEAVQVLKALPQFKVREKVRQIWNDYLASDARCPVNIDSHSYELTKKNLETADRWTYDYAAAHVYHLMKTDSYSRYLRSDMYKDYLTGSRKKTSVKGIRSIVSFSTKKDNGA